MSYVAVIADTHVADAIPELPRALLAILDKRKPVLILRAGDVTERCVLDELNEIVPTIAVKGDNDEFDLALEIRMKVHGHTIVMVHGHRPRRKEYPSILVNRAAASIGLWIRWWNGFTRDLLNKLEGYVPDCVVCVHLHYPLIRRVNRTLVVNLGGVYTNGQATQKGVPPSIAFLNISPSHIAVETVAPDSGTDALCRPRRAPPDHLFQATSFEKITKRAASGV